MRFAFFVMIWAVASPPTNAEAFVSNGLDGETANKIRVFAMAGAAAGNSPHAHDNPAAITVVRNATIEALSYDPVYFAISNSSGGQTFLLQPGKTAGFSQLANLLSRSNAADIMAVAGPLGTTVVDHYFPVDLQTSRITVSVTSTGVSSISVIRPDGSIVSANDPGVMQPSIPTAAGSAKIYSIDAPQSGNWRISIQGTGDYSALVNGDSALMFNAFRFVEPGGRPGHEGYFPITGFPIMGKTQEAIARLSGKPQSVSFEFRTRSGQVIQSFKLESPDADDSELLGN